MATIPLGMLQGLGGLVLINTGKSTFLEDLRDVSATFLITMQNTCHTWFKEWRIGLDSWLIVGLLEYHRVRSMSIKRAFTSWQRGDRKAPRTWYSPQGHTSGDLIHPPSPHLLTFPEPPKNSTTSCKPSFYGSPFVGCFGSGPYLVLLTNNKQAKYVREGDVKNGKEMRGVGLGWL